MSKDKDTLYSYKVSFTLSSLSSLDDFWSFVIFRLNIEQSEYTYDCFARIYNLLCEYSKSHEQKYPIYITLEESSKKYYINISTQHQEFLDDFTHRLKKLNFLYLHTADNLEYTINKKNPQIKTTEDEQTHSQVYNYDFLEHDDLEEMLDILERMNVKNYEQVYTTLDTVELSDYRGTFSYYSSYLKYYPELNTVNNIVAELSVILSLYTETCLQQGNDFRTLLQSFLHNIIYWQDKLFVKGNEKIDFMDNSLKADLAQLKMVLGLYDEDNNDGSLDTLDDIFDF